MPSASRGNPRWERIKLQEQEFFAERHEAIAKAPNAAARRRKIAALANSEDSAERRLFVEYRAALRNAEAASAFVRAGRSPLTGVGDVNLYFLFAGLFSALPNTTGERGC
jgi:hypothetical protein